jgi:hypothetical protein
MWDDFYGIQNNPYDSDDFRIILHALEAQVGACPEEHLQQLFDLIDRTKEALATELGG